MHFLTTKHMKILMLLAPISNDSFFRKLYQKKNLRLQTRNFKTAHFFSRAHCVSFGYAIATVHGISTL